MSIALAAVLEAVNLWISKTDLVLVSMECEIFRLGN